MGTTTTNLGLYKPAFEEVDWDDEVSANFDTLDTRVYSPHTAIQYVRKLNGDNSADGRTWATAKYDVVSAYDALSSDGGTIYVSSGNGDNLEHIVYWDSSDITRGLWLVGSMDPSYSGLPSNGPDASGFRRSKPLRLVGVPDRAYSDGTGDAASLAYIAGGSATDPLKPAIWLAGSSKQNFENIRCVDLAQTVKLGLEMSDGVTPVNTSQIRFTNCHFTSSSVAANAATTQAAVKTGYIFWVWFDHCTFGAANATLDVSGVAVVSGTTYTYTTSVNHGLVVGDTVDVIGFTPTGYNGGYVISAVTANTFTIDIGSNPAAVSVLGDARHLRSDRRAGILLGSSTGGAANSGLTMIRNCTFNGSAGVRYRPLGTTTWGAVVMEDCVTEGDFSNAVAPTFDMPTPSAAIPFLNRESSGYIYLRNLQTADGSATFGTVNLSGLKDPDMVTAINCGSITGPHQGWGNGPSLMGPGPLVGAIHSIGENRRLFGEHEGHRRAFHPVACRSANRAVDDETLWSTGEGTATVTTGQAAPDGTSRAGLLTRASGSIDYRTIGNADATVVVGDFIVGGGWYRSASSTWPADSNFSPFLMGSSNGSVTLDTAQVYTNQVGFGTRYLRGRDLDGDWRFETAVYQVKASPGGSQNLQFRIRCYNGYPFYFYGPVFLHIPGTSATYAEARDIADALASFSFDISAGEVGTMRGQTANWTGGMKVGGGGKVSKILTSSTTYDPGNMATDGSGTGTTLTVTGAAVGDPCFAGLTSLTTQAVLITAHVTTTNQVRVDLLNKTGGALDLGSGTLKVTVFQNA